MIRTKVNEGDARAQYALGERYLGGKGVAQDSEAAVRWLKLAANQGLPEAQYELGEIYVRNSWVKEDDVAAVHWTQLAANQGFGKAQVNLGGFYRDGIGVLPQDYVKAYMWYTLGISALHNDPTFIEFRGNFARNMTPAQIASAENLARDWTPVKAQYESTLREHGVATVTHEAQTPSGSASTTTAITTPQTATATEKPEHREDRAPEPHSSPQDRQSSPSPNPSNDFTWFWWVAGVIAFIMIIKSWSRASKRRKAAPRKLSRDRQGYQEVETGVPHARFNRLSGGGFEVILKNENSAYRRDYAGPLKKRGFGKDNNHIVATKDALIINGKRLRNTECRGFGHAGFEANPKFTSPEHVLGYYYGTQFHEIPGVWSAGEAEEIVLSLNLHWRALFQETSTQAEPERLRNIRSTDF